MTAARAHGGATDAGGVAVRWRHPSLTGPERDAALGLLTERERARWEATTRPEARDRFLIGHQLLREMAAELSGAPVSSIGIRSECDDCGGSHGRPLIDGIGADGPVASLSACSEVVIAALAPRATARAIGVDVEPVAGSAGRVDAIETILPAGPGRRGWREPRTETLRRWTRAEAVLKADGRGLHLDPGQVLVTGIGGERSARVDAVDYRVIELPLGRRVVASLAIATP